MRTETKDESVDPTVSEERAGTTLCVDFESHRPSDRGHRLLGLVGKK
jgi:hypothetical protein